METEPRDEEMKDKSLTLVVDDLPEMRAWGLKTIFSSITLLLEELPFAFLLVDKVIYKLIL